MAPIYPKREGPGRCGQAKEPLYQDEQHYASNIREERGSQIGIQLFSRYPIVPLQFCVASLYLTARNVVRK